MEKYMNETKEKIISVFETKDVASTKDLVNALQLENPFNRAREIKRHCAQLGIRIHHVGRSRWVYKSR